MRIPCNTFLLLLVHFLLISCQGSLRSAGAAACPAAEDTVPAVPVLLQIPAFGDVTAASGGRRSRDWERRSLQMEAETVWYKFLVGSEMSALQGTAVSGNKARLRGIVSNLLAISVFSKLSDLRAD